MTWLKWNHVNQVTSTDEINAHHGNNENIDGQNDIKTIVELENA